jgi:uncharacterized protein YjbI with pentapeptide repeats
MLGYIFLSVFALLLLTACGGNDLDQLEQSGFKECVGCDLSGANLYLADLPGVNLTEANLYKAARSRADLTGANLTGANLTGARLSDLTGPSLDQTTR